ncbi:prolyl oligopeptidase family serine peptidase [Mesorhizobium sp. M0306]|uniref:prolyl oligopeptidase family serine peptidase n=1 Tax=Mesorhizobium sp. M0306 TaxID=2956932 RepID=UPI0033382DEC
MGDKRLEPPLPRAEPRIRVLHDDITTDRYRWLRDRDNPDVRAYLEAENCYAEQATEHLTELKAQLVAEIQGRQPSEGAAPAFQVGPFEYFQLPQRGGTHSAWWRRPTTGGPAELVLDPNEIPGAGAYYALGVFEPSDDGRYVAFSVDLIGNEGYELTVRDMADGRDIWRDSGRAGKVVWAADNHTLFFTRELADQRRHDRVVRLDVERADSEVVFEETADRLEVQIRRSDSGAWLFLDLSPVAGGGGIEVWCLAADEPGAEWRRIVTREFGHEVFAEHWKDAFLFRVNDAGPYWRLVRAPIDDPAPSRWEEFVPHNEGTLLEEVHVLEDHLVVIAREGLRPRLVCYDRRGRVGATIVPDEPSCSLTVGLSAGGDYSVARHAYRGSRLTYCLSSFVTPSTVFEHDLDHDQSVVLYKTHIPGYDPANYTATVVLVETEDGVQIPISLVVRRGRKGAGPVLLGVYGCHAAPRWPSFFMTPSFMNARLSLLDRGVAFGIVHVRGGGEFGRPWWQAAVKDRKRITHTDLIAAAEGLIEQGLATREEIVILGRSAGGGTVLATAALRPDLFRAVVAEVPVADILDTVIDYPMPYAAVEAAEYGDPRVAREYRYIRTYDPYYNLHPDRPLPPTYVDTALDDSQVLFFQPARYVAQRRSCAADRDPKLVFRVMRIGGHSGPSHGVARAEDHAFRLAWILDQLNYSRTDPLD